MANCLRRRDQMVYSIFFKIVPLGAPRLSKDSKVEENIYIDGLIIDNDHQFFQDLYYQKLGNIFFCADFMNMTFIPLFRNVNKIHNDKRRPK